MAPCCSRCGNIRVGRGRGKLYTARAVLCDQSLCFASSGYCTNLQCRREEQQEKDREKEAAKARRAAAKVSARGPMPAEDSRRAQKQELQAARKEEGGGTRGPMPAEDSRRAQKQELQAARKEEGGGTRGPMPAEDSRRAQKQELQAARKEEGGGTRGPMPAEDSRRAQKQEFQAARKEEGGGTRGPMPAEDSRRAQKQELQAARKEEGGGTRGPMPAEDSRRAQKQELQAARKEEGGGTRGPMPGQGAGGRPFIPEDHKQGPPYRDEEHLTEEAAQRKYKDFVRSWARFGLSRVCKSCGTLSPAKHCRPTAPAQIPTCRNCRENKTKFRLPPLLPVPLPLQQLKPIEQHLLAMARISQVVLDKLPSGGPSAQWGRMYAVLMEDPCICEVLSGAVLEEDGTVHVQGIDGMTESPARLENQHSALQELQTRHKLYQNSSAVHEAISKMNRILQRKTPAASRPVPTTSNTIDEEDGDL